jgi:hypothetical protein
MSISAKLGDIRVDELSTWQDKLFLTLDIDWAHDEILAKTIDLLDRSGVQATWFVTHDTPLLERLCANPNYELGIHPNFNWLLAGDSRNGATAVEVDVLFGPLLALNDEYCLWLMIQDGPNVYCEYKSVSRFFAGRAGNIGDRNASYWQPCTFVHRPYAGPAK